MNEQPVSLCDGANDDEMEESALRAKRKKRLSELYEKLNPKGFAFMNL